MLKDFQNGMIAGISGGSSGYSFPLGCRITFMMGSDVYRIIHCNLGDAIYSPDVSAIVDEDHWVVWKTYDNAIVEFPYTTEGDITLYGTVIDREPFTDGIFLCHMKNLTPEFGSFYDMKTNKYLNSIDNYSGKFYSSSVYNLNCNVRDPNNSDVRLDGNTLEFWLKLNHELLPDDYFRIFGINFEMNSSTQYKLVMITPIPYEAYTVCNFVPGNWYHISVYAGSKSAPVPGFRLYIDGQLVKSVDKNANALATSQIYETCTSDVSLSEVAVFRGMKRTGNFVRPVSPYKV